MLISVSNSVKNVYGFIGKGIKAVLGKIVTAPPEVSIAENIAAKATARTAAAAMAKFFSFCGFLKKAAVFMSFFICRGSFHIRRFLRL